MLPQYETSYKKQQPPCYSLHHMRICPTKGQPWDVGSPAVLSIKDLGVSRKDKTLRDKTTGFLEPCQPHRSCQGDLGQPAPA